MGQPLSFHKKKYTTSQVIGLLQRKEAEIRAEIAVYDRIRSAELDLMYATNSALRANMFQDIDETRVASAHTFAYIRELKCRFNHLKMRNKQYELNNEQLPILWQSAIMLDRQMEIPDALLRELARLLEGHISKADAALQAASAIVNEQASSTVTNEHDTSIGTTCQITSTTDQQVTSPAPCGQAILTPTFSPEQNTSVATDEPEVPVAVVEVPHCGPGYTTDITTTTDEQATLISIELQNMINSLKNFTIEASLKAGTFVYFPFLPKEVRNQIWSEAASEPQAIQAHIIQDSRFRGNVSFAPMALHSALIKFNHEARVEASIILKIYKQELRDNSHDCTIPLIAMNPDADTLWISNFHPVWSIKRCKPTNRSFPRIRRLALPSQAWHAALRTSSPTYLRLSLILEACYEFEVEEIILVVGSTRCAKQANSSDISFIRPRNAHFQLLASEDLLPFGFLTNPIGNRINADNTWDDLVSFASQRADYSFHSQGNMRGVPSDPNIPFQMNGSHPLDRFLRKHFIGAWNLPKIIYWEVMTGEGRKKLWV